MNYDIAFRYQQALDPSALTSIPGALHGISAAIEDCRRAGKAVDTDPAVLLLVRHLASLGAGGNSSDAALRTACMDEISELRRKPVLGTLALRGVAYDADAKKLFHSEARRALLNLAEALGYEKADYNLRSNMAGPAVSGEVTFHSDELYVQASCDGHGRGILYRRCRDRNDYLGLRNWSAPLVELTNPARFAARICNDLGLGVPALDNRLVA